MSRTRTFGKTTLQEITVEGVGAAFTSHAESGASKGVKAHFKMDESGLLSIDTVRGLSFF